MLFLSFGFQVKSLSSIKGFDLIATMIKLKKNQIGMTLIEVLVGFVIFSSSLVAVLDYVSGQIYLGHMSSKNLLKVQYLYELSTVESVGKKVNFDFSDEFIELDWSVESTVMDVTSQRNGDTRLNRVDFFIQDNNSSLPWSVIKIN